MKNGDSYVVAFATLPHDSPIDADALTVANMEHGHDVERAKEHARELALRTCDAAVWKVEVTLVARYTRTTDVVEVE